MLQGCLKYYQEKAAKALLIVGILIVIGSAFFVRM